MSLKHSTYNFSIFQNHQISYTKPDISVGLVKPPDNTVASPLHPKSVMIKTPATPPMMGAHHNIYEFEMIQWYILNNCDELEPFLE